MQAALYVMIVLDACVVIAEILLDLHAMRMQYSERAGDLADAMSFLRQAHADDLDGYAGDNFRYMLGLLNRAADKRRSTNDSLSVTWSSGVLQDQLDSIGIPASATPTADGSHRYRRQYAISLPVSSDSPAQQLDTNAQVDDDDELAQPSRQHIRQATRTLSKHVINWFQTRANAHQDRSPEGSRQYRTEVQPGGAITTTTTLKSGRFENPLSRWRRAFDAFVVADKRRTRRSLASVVGLQRSLEDNEVVDSRSEADYNERPNDRNDKARSSGTEENGNDSHNSVKTESSQHEPATMIIENATEKFEQTSSHLGFSSSSFSYENLGVGNPNEDAESTDETNTTSVSGDLEPSMEALKELGKSYVDMLLKIAHVLHYIGIGILTFFVVQVLLKIFSMGHEFWKKKLEIFDAVIVMTSFSLDLIFIEGLTGEQSESAIALLIIFLLWRILRIINGIMVTSKKRQEIQMQLLKRARRRAQKKIEYLEDDRNWKEREIGNLRRMCTERGCTEEEIAMCKPRRRTIYQKMDTSMGLSSIASLSLGLSMSMTGAGRSVMYRSGLSGGGISSASQPHPTQQPSTSSNAAESASVDRPTSCDDDDPKRHSLQQLFPLPVPQCGAERGGLRAATEGLRRASFVGVMQHVSAAAQNRLGLLGELPINSMRAPLWWPPRPVVVKERPLQAPNASSFSVTPIAEIAATTPDTHDVIKKAGDSSACLVPGDCRGVVEEDGRAPASPSISCRAEEIAASASTKTIRMTVCRGRSTEDGHVTIPDVIVDIIDAPIASGNGPDFDEFADVVSLGSMSSNNTVGTGIRLSQSMPFKISSSSNDDTLSNLQESRRNLDVQSASTCSNSNDYGRRSDKHNCNVALSDDNIDVSSSYMRPEVQFTESRSWMDQQGTSSTNVYVSHEQIPDTSSVEQSEVNCSFRLNSASETDECRYSNDWRTHDKNEDLKESGLTTQDKHLHGEVGIDIAERSASSNSGNHLCVLSPSIGAKRKLDNENIQVDRLSKLSEERLRQSGAVPQLLGDVGRSRTLDSNVFGAIGIDNGSSMSGTQKPRQVQKQFPVFKALEAFSLDDIAVIVNNRQLTTEYANHCDDFRLTATSSTYPRGSVRRGAARGSTTNESSTSDSDKRHHHQNNVAGIVTELVKPVQLFAQSRNYRRRPKIPTAVVSSGGTNAVITTATSITSGSRSNSAKPETMSPAARTVLIKSTGVSATTMVKSVGALGYCDGARQAWSKSQEIHPVVRGSVVTPTASSSTGRRRNSVHVVFVEASTAQLHIVNATVPPTSDKVRYVNTNAVTYLSHLAV